MECLKVKLLTPTGVFKNPLSIKGIETYPLPPYSTIIGLIYRAIGRKWQGEHFQISIQGDYKSIFRDYIWFKAYNTDEKTIERIPLEVPTMYVLELVIHIKAQNNLLQEIENALKKPAELLFLSGGEYPVKIEYVKKVKCEEKRKISEDEAVDLKRNFYIPEKIYKNIAAGKNGILFNLPYFYKSSKPKIYQWEKVYYFPKGTPVYKNLFFDEEEDLVFLSSDVDYENKEKEEEFITLYADNWLMAAACVGILKVIKDNFNIEEFANGRVLKIPKDVWEKLPKFYANYLLKDAKDLLNNSKDQKNPYNTIILTQIGDFHNNSPFTNQSHEYIKRLKGFSYSDPNVLEEIKKSFLQAYQRMLSDSKNLDSICFFCKERQAKNLIDAVHFTPLFASLKKKTNFFWDPIPICKECEFSLYFACVGFHKVKEKYTFVYIPDDILKTYNLNVAISKSKDVSKEKLGMLFDTVKLILNNEEQKSKWVLENIYFIEIKKVGDATANIYSFHIHPKLAKAIKNQIKKYPKSLSSVFSDFLIYIYSNRSLYEFLFYLLSGFLKKESFKNAGSNTLEERIVSAGKNLKVLDRSILFFIEFQMEVLNMNIEKDYTDWAYTEGLKLKQAYKQEYELEDKLKKKVETLSYRLLDAIRRKDINHFAQNIIRAYLEVEKEIPYFFKEALKDENFSALGYAFLMGLNSSLKDNKNGSYQEPSQ